VRSISRLASPRDTVVVVNQAHGEFYDRIAQHDPSIVVQPFNRGSVPAILYGLRRLAHLGRNTVVVVFPCDDFFAFESHERFIRHIEEAIAAVEASPFLSVVLGTVPRTSESALGWIEPGESACPADPSIFHVRSYWRSPPVDLAIKLIRKGWLWNSLTIVARAPRLQEMIAECLPELYVAFNTAFAPLKNYGERIAIENFYRNIGTYRFSEQILARCPPDLAVKRIDSAELDNIISQETPDRRCAGFAHYGPTPVAPMHFRAK